MNINLVFVIISFVLGFFITAYIRSFDIYEKEPLPKMFLVVIWGGVWSILLCSFMYDVVEKAGVSIVNDFWGALFVIGPVEEAAKFLALLSAYLFIKKDLNEPTDGLVYMTCVALGFSLIENYFYATKIPDSGHLLFLRLFISTPAHICFSIFMGISFYVIIKYKTGAVLLFVSYIYACIVHGLFNSIIFHGWIIGFLFALIAFSKNFLFHLLSYTTAKSPFRKSLNDFVASYEEPKKEVGIECINCGSLNNKTTYKIEDLTFQKCDKCSFFVSTKGNIFRIFRFFGLPFRDFTNRYWDAKFHKRKYSTLYKNNYISDEKRLGFFKLNELDDALDELRESHIQIFENKWWFPDKLRLTQATRENQETKTIVIPLLITVFILGLSLSIVDSMETRLAIIVGLWPFIIIFFGVIYSVVSQHVETNKKKNSSVK